MSRFTLHIAQFPIANIEFIEYIHFTPFCPDDQFSIYESLNSLLAWINARSHCLVAFPHCVPRHIHRLLVSRFDVWPSDPLSTFKPSHPRCLQKPLSLSRLISYTLHKLSHFMCFSHILHWRPNLLFYQLVSSLSKPCLSYWCHLHSHHLDIFSSSSQSGQSLPQVLPFISSWQLGSSPSAPILGQLSCRPFRQQGGNVS